MQRVALGKHGLPIADKHGELLQVIDSKNKKGPTGFRPVIRGYMT